MKHFLEELIIAALAWVPTVAGMGARLLLWRPLFKRCGQARFGTGLAMPGCKNMRLADGVRIGDLVVATAAVQHDADTSPLGDPVGMVSKVNLVELPCDEGLRARLVAAAKKADLTIHEGIIATGDQFIHDGATRARIHQLFGALAVEMEGGAVAQAASMSGVPFAVVRAISDLADGTAAASFEQFEQHAADASAAAVLQALALLD